MKMISSTRITSMNGVTLISWISLKASSPWSRRTLMVIYSAAVAVRRRSAGRSKAPRSRSRLIEAQDFGRGIGMQRAIAGDPAREHIVHHHRRDRRHQPERGRQQRLGDAGRHHRQIGGVRLRDADEAVHDAPHRAEQSDERRGGADGGENAGAADHLPAGGGLDALQPRGDALLHAGGRHGVGRQPQFGIGGGDQRGRAVAAPLQARAHLAPGARLR